MKEPMENREQEIIDSVSESLDAASQDLENKNDSKSFFSTMVSCAPYVIMGLGCYYIWSRVRGVFKPHDDFPHKHKEEGEAQQ